MTTAKFIPGALEDQFRKLIETATGEFETNERLKWILLGGLVILYLSFLIFLANGSERARTDLLASQTQLQQLASQTLETGWTERADAAQSLADTLSRQFWPGDTTGLAEAGFERWIRQTFDQNGIEVRQVLLTRGPALEDALGFDGGPLSSSLKIRAKVIAPLTEAGLIRFLNEAAANTSWVIVEQLIIRSGRNPRFELDLATYSGTGDTEP